MVQYMKRCAERPNYKKAFGEDHADVIIAKADSWLNSGKMFGVF
jgi:hypothetical protein